MADVLETISVALREAEQKGYERGYDAALSDVGGQNAGVRVAQVLADAVESASTRFREDPIFARALKLHADRLRKAAEPPTVKGKPAFKDGAFSVQFDGDVDEKTALEALILRAASGGPALKATASYDQATRTLRLTPDHDLTDGVEYVAQAKGVRSLEGGAEMPASEWRFSHRTPAA